MRARRVMRNPSASGTKGGNRFYSHYCGCAENDAPATLFNKFAVLAVAQLVSRV